MAGASKRPNKDLALTLQLHSISVALFLSLWQGVIWEEFTQAYSLISRDNRIYKISDVFQTMIFSGKKINPEIEMFPVMDEVSLSRGGGFVSWGTSGS